MKQKMRFISIPSQVIPLDPKAAEMMFGALCMANFEGVCISEVVEIETEKKPREKKSSKSKKSGPK